MGRTLCVLLWARPGCSDALVAYEDRVLPLVAVHGGAVLQRVRSDGVDGRPLEIQLIQFPTDEAYDRYMSDPRRAAMAAERDAAIARTDLFEVQPV